MTPALNLAVKSGCMPRARTGSFWYDRNGDLYARVTWTDSVGKTHEKRRKSISGTKREARSHIKEILEDIEERGDVALDGATLTLKELSEYYKAKYAIPAEYDKQGMKKAGMRSWKDARSKADSIAAYFGSKKKVRDVTYGDLSVFKSAELRRPAVVEKVETREVKGKKVKVRVTMERPRAIASVHRKLEILRRMLTIAVQHRWLRRNPFNEGEPLIKKAEEHMRERIAQRDEERALLEACDEDERRYHLKPFLILAFDTGFRPIEMTQLKVQDVDFEENCITVVSYKGKRRKERQFEMTRRLRIEMEKLCAGKKPATPVFGFKSVKRSFATAKRIAKMEGIDLKDFRLYDVRHTTTTRVIKGGMPVDEAGKLFGHSQPSTTWRYVNPDTASRIRAGEILNSHNEDE